MEQGQPQSATPHLQRQPWELYALVGSLVALSALVITGNVPDVSLWLLALLVLGVGQALLLPPTAGLLGGLLVLVLWVLLRRATGILVRPELLQNALEVLGLTLNLLLAVGYTRVWQRQQRELGELRTLQSVLVAGEVDSGLLSFEVAELRLREELDRAQAFHRPLGLLLVESEWESSGDDGKQDEAYRMVARQLAAASLVHDIPFQIDQNRFGLLLPERDWDELYRYAEDVVKMLEDLSLPDLKGGGNAERVPLKFRFGLGVYDGKGEGDIDLLRTAEDSLQISRDLAEVGAPSITAYAMPATPIIESERATRVEGD